MNRRTLIAGFGAVAAAGLARSAIALGQVDLAQSARPLWESWKSAFLGSDGRVIDGLQRDASHSEGQGYGMVLAAIFDDAASFQSMYHWTERNLAIRPDPLLAWRWLPGQGNPVPDRNNASDGDLFYAWALVKAAQKFNNPGYLARARDIAQALAETCVVAMPGSSDQTVFLPAAFGFQHDTHMSINPSYYMPVAMRELAAATGVSRIAICAQQGEALLNRIAAEGLVPDWVDVSEGGVSGSQSLSSNAGYEALRVPLFMIWSRIPQHAAVRRMAAVYERTVQPGVGVPTVIEPLSGVVLETSGDMGYQALAGLTMCSARNATGAAIPPFSADQPYYPATLQLFAMVASNETLPECVPL
ncbi:glycosyl hydrolase family 8 [Roseinatronobacter alkalisoli]|uniref:cellulase n=1 Tax=Roseinatronobacter alkalisoli TaxID=3028235 RepID=A0ABT5T3S8_9RHOB|nr:glycosyl hydrolase family 8 [Roseinatronobacter sp. HJB301]MDD7969780.1 glycosyl hydrolase family 8 [Roseinatronobacter sp. HJB301]